MISIGSFSKCALFGAIALSVGGGRMAGAGVEFTASEQQRVNMCHYDGQGRARLITFSEDAALAHSGNHGDHPPLDFFVDADGDGFGAGAGVSACTAPPGTVSNNGDCNDSNAAVNPGAEEVCGDNTDNNCDGQFAAPEPIFVFASSGGQRFDAPQGICTTHLDITVQVCRETPTQTVKLSSTPDGAGNAYFDELGTVVVSAVGGPEIAGANYRWWEPVCLTPGYPDIPVGTAPTQIDISNLFDGQYGIFDVNVRVRNAFQPYEWFSTFVVPIP